MASIQHLAIIMDGNGRWAKEKGMPRMMGHQEGVKVAKEIIKHCAHLCIPFVTLYVFSTENKNRSSTEVNALMNLLKKHLSSEVSFYQEYNVRVLHIGDLDGLPQDVQKKIIKVQEATKDLTGTSVILAINYGGRDEIVRAIKKMLEGAMQDECTRHNAQSTDITNIDEETLSSHLDTNRNIKIPDVDLLIRTGNEKRISNFLLWQIAYSELYFSDKYWPDWCAEDLDIAIADYNNRNRRFGREK